MYDHERSLVKRLKDKPFALVGVNFGDELEDIKIATKEKNLIWRSFFAGQDTEIIDSYDVRGFPTIMILDADGVIQSVGHRTDDATIEELLAEME
jgi:hypothetical protein